MSVISGAFTVLANARSGNVLAGDVFEFLTRPSLVNFLVTGAVIGISCDILVGGSAAALNATCPIRAAAAPFPIKPDDSIVIVGGATGERLFLDLINSTAGNIIAQFLVEIGA